MYDITDKQIPNILDYIGKFEKPRFFPPFDVSDLLLTPMSDLYKIYADNSGNSSPFRFPKRQDVISLPCSGSSDDFSNLYMSFQQVATQSDWRPTWFRDSDSFCSRNMSIEVFQQYWFQYVTLMTPGADISSTDSPEKDFAPNESEENRRIMRILASSAPFVNTECFLNNDVLLQRTIGLFNVFTMTENSESRVVVVVTFSLGTEALLV